MSCVFLYICTGTFTFFIQFIDWFSYWNFLYSKSAFTKFEALILNIIIYFYIWTYFVILYYTLCINLFSRKSSSSKEINLHWIYLDNEQSGKLLTDFRNANLQLLNKFLRILQHYHWIFSTITECFSRFVSSVKNQFIVAMNASDVISLSSDTRPYFQQKWKYTHTYCDRYLYILTFISNQTWAAEVSFCIFKGRIS